jgi:hypothetical protein
VYRSVSACLVSALATAVFCRMARPTTSVRSLYPKGEQEIASVARRPSSARRSRTSAFIRLESMSAESAAAGRGSSSRPGLGQWPRSVSAPMFGSMGLYMMPRPGDGSARGGPARGSRSADGGRPTAHLANWRGTWPRSSGKGRTTIAGSIAEWHEWQRQNPGRDVRYLTKERAEAYLARGMPKGTLHRIGTWETSSARRAAEGLER